MGFFEDVLPDGQGYVPIITRDEIGRLVKFKWFAWPSEVDLMVDHCLANAHTDVYFSPFLYKRPTSLTNPSWARKENVLQAACAWADGDEMDEQRLRVAPTTFVRTSEHCWQAYWRPTDAENYGPFDFEALSHGIFDAHADDKMDRGWPLAKKMRVPFTTNTKREKAYQVTYDTHEDREYTFAEVAAEYDPVDDFEEVDVPDGMPDLDINVAMEILNRVNDPQANDRFTQPPGLTQDWSSALYNLECILFERGCTPEETFVVAHFAECNKFERDGRPVEHLWNQVHRDHARWEHFQTEGTIDFSSLELDPEAPEFDILDVDMNGCYWSNVSLLRTDDEVPEDTFIDAFVAWAQSKSSQSPREFNEAGAVALLSTTLARYAYLPLSFGPMNLNLYFMVLGRTTQSRKSTSLGLVRTVLKDLTEGEIDQYLIPEDNTPEALSKYLSGKSAESSLLAIDEFQDKLREAARKGSYTSGLIAFLTLAYDGRIPGVLRKTGDVAVQRSVEHFMTFYSTGILNQSADALTLERIESGFVPRCIIVADGRNEFSPGANDVTFLSQDEEIKSDAYRKAISKSLAKRLKFWNQQYLDRVAYTTPTEDPRIRLRCTEEAYDRWQQFAYDVQYLAASHPTTPAALFPVCERLSFSVLRVSGLIAMAHGEEVIRLSHVVKAISLADTWVRCSEVLVANVINTGFSQDVSKVEKFVASQPQGRTTHQHLLTKFQSEFDSPTRVSEILSFCTKKGTLREAVSIDKERIISYVKL